MQTVPLQPTPSQTLSVTLGGQFCEIAVHQNFYGMIIDVSVDGALIIGGVLAENLNRIVRDVYLGFIGDFVFYDTQGHDDPYWDGLGSRFVLLYLSEADLEERLRLLQAAA